VATLGAFQAGFSQFLEKTVIPLKGINAFFCHAVVNG